MLGGVGHNPEQRISRNGSAYAVFNMYTNIEMVKKNGELAEQTEMHNVMAFGGLARYVASNLQKGIALLICLYILSALCASILFFSG